MNEHEFDVAVDDAMARLPAWVREALDNIEVLVLDEADEDLDPDREDLLGLYVGTPIKERGVDYSASYRT